MNEPNSIIMIAAAVIVRPVIARRG